MTDFQHNYHFQISALGLFLKFRKFSLDILIKYIILLKKKKSVITPLTDSEERQPRLIEAGVPTPWSGYRKRARKLTFLQSSGIK